MWLIGSWARILHFSLDAGGRYLVSFKYSNLDSTQSETFTITVDFDTVAEYSTLVSGDWDVFLWSGPLAVLDLELGEHELTVTVVGSDPSGIELDVVILELVQ